MAKDVITKIEVPFPTERHADIVYQVLRVDAEPKRSEVKKSLELENNILKVQFIAKEIRKVRVAVTSFFESINLITSTLASFPEPESKYDFYTK